MRLLENRFSLPWLPSRGPSSPFLGNPQGPQVFPVFPHHNETPDLDNCWRFQSHQRAQGCQVLSLAWLWSGSSRAFLGGGGKWSLSLWDLVWHCRQWAERFPASRVLKKNKKLTFNRLGCLVFTFPLLQYTYIILGKIRLCEKKINMTCFCSSKWKPL